MYNKINWKLLKKQKLALLGTIDSLEDPDTIIHLQGIVHLLDALQDFAVDEFGYDKNEIFYFGENKNA